MGIKEDLEQEVSQIFTPSTSWSERDGQKVPEADDLRLGNDAVKLDATVLYADMSESTKLVDGYRPWFAAEVYKAYLTCAARLVREHGGSITAYDGDRIMAVFIGNDRNSSAAVAALKLNYAVLNIINPVMASKFSNVTFKLSHVVGIDASPLCRQNRHQKIQRPRLGWPRRQLCRENGRDKEPQQGIRNGCRIPETQR
ncbi:MAG: hypothetical protein QM756_16410 [Polyangiaceae bacterium]